MELSAIYFYIWVLERYASDGLRFSFFWGLCVGFPIFCIWREQRSFPEFSLDWRVFVRCLREVLWFTLGATALLLAVAFGFDGLNYDGKILLRVSEYLFWSFLQQIGLQTFLARRVHQVVPNPMLAAGLTATVFSLIHFPNPALLALTWVGGFFWTSIFLKTPNLYALAISHGWLAVMALYCVPSRWLHQLRIGPTYWTYNP